MSYARGAERERDLVRHMRERGWVASRTAGSHGPWDVIALKRGERAQMLQLKAGARRWPTRDERARLSVDAARAGARAFVVFWQPRQPPEFVPEPEWPS